VDDVKDLLKKSAALVAHALTCRNVGDREMVAIPVGNQHSRSIGTANTNKL